MSGVRLWNILYPATTGGPNSQTRSFQKDRSHLVGPVFSHQSLCYISSLVFDRSGWKMEKECVGGGRGGDGGVVGVAASRA